MVDAEESSLSQKRLNVLVDRTISDITPIENFDFITDHANFSIGLQYATEEGEELGSFGIVLESGGDQAKEQVLLDL